MTNPPANTGRNQGRFRPGESGNPSGKPPGTRNRATILFDAITDADLQAILAKIVEQAKAGDLVAAKMIFDRLAPAPRARTVSLDLPEVGKYDGGNAILAGYTAIVVAVAAGQIAPSEALELCEILDRQRQALTDLDSSRLQREPTPEELAARKRAAERQRQSAIQIEALENGLLASSRFR